MNWYCAYSEDKPIHKTYHDREYGFPNTDEQGLFELLAMEIFQPGLSWDLVLKKRDGANLAFEGFVVDTVAAYGEQEIERLLNDPRLIRNRRKIEAIIYNAQVIKSLRKTHDGFARWLESHHPRSHASWVKVFKKTFKFTGPEVTKEFLMGIGYLPGAHRADCPIYKVIEKSSPPWMQVDEKIYQPK